MRRITFVLFLVFFTLPAFASNLIDGHLPNGLTYIILKNSDLPLVSVNIKIKAGSVFDEPGKFGEAYVLGNALENCDSPKYKAERLRLLFDKYGVVSSVSIDKGYITISASALESNITPLFCLMHEILRSKLDEACVSYVKRNTVNQIESLKNDKDYLAIHAAFVNLIKNNSYSHTSLGTVEGVKHITTEDLKRFYRHYFNAKNMVVSVAGGGFTNEEIKEAIKLYFSFLKPGKGVDFPRVEFKKGLHVRDIVKPRTYQSYIYFAFPGFELNCDNYYASKLLAFILGGNLGSYLVKDIRTRHGYAYSVFSFVYRLPKKSVFVIGLQTQNKFTLKAIERVFEDIKSYDKYLTEENLEHAKHYISGSLPIGLQRPQAVARALSDGYMLGLKGLPWEYELKRFESVNLDQLRSVADRLFSGTVSIGIVSYKDFGKDIHKFAEKYGYR